MRWFALLLVLASPSVACGSDGGPPTVPVVQITSEHDGGAAETPASITDGGTPSTPPIEDAEAPPPPVEHSGDATYYAATSTGACGIKTPSDKLVGAVGSSLYGKEICGQCAEVTGPKGSVVVLLNDRCAGCKGGSLDLATQAFVQIADKSAGRVKITWHLTDCP